MGRFLKLTIMLSATVLLAACGGDGDGESNNGGDNNGIEPVEIGELDDQSFKRMRAEAWARSFCETAFNDCPNQARHLGSAKRSTDVEDCVQKRLASYDSFPHNTPDGVEFDEEAARSCLVDVITAQRKDVCYYPDRAQSAACDEALKPTLETGEECVSFSECISGTCVRTSTGGGGVGTMCTGTCGTGRPTAKAGEACGFDTADCDDTLNLSCNYTEQGGPGVCVERGTLAEGEACSNSFLCQDGLVCRDDQCTTLTLSQDGESCETSPSNTTAPDPQPCATGLVCTGLDDNNQGTCTSIVGESDSCAETDECKWGLYCDGSACQPTKGAGESCEDTDECSSHLFCMAGSCEEPDNPECVQGG